MDPVFSLGEAKMERTARIGAWTDINDSIEQDLDDFRPKQ